MTKAGLAAAAAALAVVAACIRHPTPQPASMSSPAPAGPGKLTVVDWDGHRGAVSFSFDDAQPSHIAHYAELQATGAPMTFYINQGNQALPGFDETWTRAVKDGHELGDHTAHHCHADMSGCIFGGGLADGGEEIDENRAFITQRYGQGAVWTMAAPFGDRGWEKLARERYFLHRGVAPGMIAPGDRTDPWSLPGSTPSPTWAPTGAARPCCARARASGRPTAG